MAIAEWTEVDCELWCDACALAGMGHGRSFSLDPFGRGRVGPVLTLTQPHRDEQATGQSKSARIRQEKQKTETHRFQ